MLWTVLKWGVPAVLLIAEAGAVFTRKTFHFETVIEALPEEIWVVLIDTAYWMA